MMKARYNGQGKMNFGQGKSQGISFHTKGGHPVNGMLVLISYSNVGDY